MLFNLDIEIINKLYELGWAVGLSPIVPQRTWDYRENALRGVLSKGSYSIFTVVLDKTTGKYERLGCQAQPGIEPRISCLPALNA